MQQRGSVIALVGGLVIAEGLVAWSVGFAAFEARAATLALLSGWIVAACGLLAWLRAPTSRIGSLLVAVAVAWFAGAFQGASSEGLAALGARLQFVYAAILVQALLTYPDGRLADRSTPVVIGLAYVAAFMPSPLASTLVGTILALALVVRAMTTRSGGRARAWPDLVPWIAGVPMATALVVTPYVTAWLPGGSAIDVRALVQVVLVLAAIGLAAGLVWTWETRARVTDFVVDLGAGGGVGIDRALATAVGDPGLRVGYWTAPEGRYLDAGGRPVDLPDDGHGQRITFVSRGREPVAVLVHDSAVGADPAVRAAIVRAAELSAVNVGMRAQARSQIEEIRASRRRLVEAGDAERRVLQELLRATVDPELANLERGVADAELHGDDQDPALASSLQHIRDVRVDLAELAEGLSPGLLRLGLPGALRELADRSPVPVYLEMDADADSTAPAATRAALFFVASEALTNVSRHAGATHARLRLVMPQDGILELEIADDGRGGADPGRGTGLRGLRDRVEAHGGRLLVVSPVGGGTRLVVRLPINEHWTAA